MPKWEAGLIALVVNIILVAILFKIINIVDVNIRKK